MSLWTPATSQMSREDWSLTCEKAGLGPKR
jgi:hypothetical protein